MDEMVSSPIKNGQKEFMKDIRENYCNNKDFKINDIIEKLVID